MQRLFSGARRGVAVAVVALVVVMVAPTAFGDGENPYEPPEARIKPPVGVTSEPATSNMFDVFVRWLRTHIGELTID